MQYNQVSKHFREYNRANICPATAYYWVKKYGKVLRHLSMKQIPELSGKMNIDEFVSKIKKNKFLQMGKQRQKKKIQD